MFKNKSLFFERWVQNQILLVGLLFSGKGLLFTYRKFLFTYKFPITPKELAIVFDATPTGTIILFRNVVRPFTQIRISPQPS